MLPRQAFVGGAAFLFLFVVLYCYFFFRVEHVTNIAQGAIARFSGDAKGINKRHFINAPKHTQWQYSRRYVWAFGLASKCVGINHYSPHQLWAGVNRTWNDKSTYANTASGDLVWIFAPDACIFVDDILPAIKHPFVLMISGEDHTFPKDLLGGESFHRLVSNLNVIHIFAQNFDSRKLPEEVFNKVSHVPIGYDFHTHAYKEYPPTDVTTEEAMLDDIIDHMPARSKRKLRIFADFQHFDSMRLGRWRDFDMQDRHSIFAALNASGIVDYSESRLAREETFKIKTHYAFTASPPGNGIDCHRTWEDLLMGCIVIVMETGLEPMYDGLPVVVVKNWTEVNQEKLVLWERLFRNMTFESYRHRLTSDYWLEKMVKYATPFRNTTRRLR